MIEQQPLDTRIHGLNARMRRGVDLYHPLVMGGDETLLVNYL